MPRPLVFGNGSLLVQIDRRHRIRDLFFPHVGQFNHLAGHSVRMGVWREGRFSWCDSDEWAISQAYEPQSTVGRSRLRCEALQVELELAETIDEHQPIFSRLITVHNHGDEAEIRLFFAHDLRLEESDIGDTALYHPSGSIIHYKRHTALLFRGTWGDAKIHEYQCATRNGPWPESDAEDGVLSMNPIEQGSVASVFSLRARVERQGLSEAKYMIVAGVGTQEVLDLVSEVLTPRPWQPHFKDGGDWHDLSARGLMTVMSQINANGAILAGNDSDILETARATYSYLWPRDGALVASVLDAAGTHAVTKKFFELCTGLLPSDPPMFFHKYGPDGALGASWHPYVWEGHPIVPFQEDSTALVVWALGEHLKHGGDHADIARWYDRMVGRVCNFMATYVDERGLPLPSWDLWEERRGVHAYTAATVIAGLRAGARLAVEFGKKDGEAWLVASERMVTAVRKHLWNAERKCFWRMEGDATIDAATLAFGALGILPPDDPMVVENANTIEQVLSVRGGLARYENDYYFRQRDGYAGNPWVITTMWLAQTRIRQGERQEAERALQWVRDHQETTGILAEQYHPDTGQPLSVSPLTWSHAEVVRTIQMLEGLGEATQLPSPDVNF